ncbi:MAG: hypothetical protein LBK53_04565 [Heliobacteriaceae bacterium]|nr:hypothetical protein [Heliobacteriaceae bacterium]
MQIHSVGSSPNFSGRRDNVDAFINTPDVALRQVSYLKAAHDTHDKRHKKLSSLIYYSIPAAFGVRAALNPRYDAEILKEGKPLVVSLTENKKFNLLGNTKSLNGRAAKAARGLKAGGLAVLAFAAVDALIAGGRKLSRKSPEVRNFEQNHQLLSLAALIGAGYGVLRLGGKGIDKLGNTLGNLANKSTLLNKNAARINNFEGKVLKLGNKVNNSKFFNRISESIDKITPSIKETAKGVVNFAPLGLVIGGVVHSVNHAAVRNREYAKNYNELKEKQLILTGARTMELSKQQQAELREAKLAAVMAVAAEAEAAAEAPKTEAAQEDACC